jgi:hypothetical protein
MRLGWVGFSLVWFSWMALSTCACWERGGCWQARMAPQVRSPSPPHKRVGAPDRCRRAAKRRRARPHHPRPGSPAAAAPAPAGDRSRARRPRLRAGTARARGAAPSPGDSPEGTAALPRPRPRASAPSGSWRFFGRWAMELGVLVHEREIGAGWLCAVLATIRSNPANGWSPVQAGAEPNPASPRSNMRSGQPPVKLT